MSGPLSPFGAENPLRPSSGQSMPTMRRYTTRTLSAAGHVEDRDFRAPVTPEFQTAFNAFAHGSLVATTQGPVAIEDLMPGMEVHTLEHGPLPVLWIGVMTYLPNPHGAPVLTRVTADRFGMAQPAMDLLAGPGARLLHRPAGARFAHADRLAYTPLRDFIDGDSVIGISPRMAVDTYHISLRRHATIRVGGVEMETFHPGMSVLEEMGTHTRQLFMSMFPHMTRATDFGRLAHPRLRMRAMEDAAA